MGYKYKYKYATLSKDDKTRKQPNGKTECLRERKRTRRGLLHIISCWEVTSSCRV